MLALLAVNLMLSLTTLLVVVHLWVHVTRTPEAQADVEKSAAPPMPKGFSRGQEFWNTAHELLRDPQGSARLASDALKLAMVTAKSAQNAGDADTLVNYMLTLQRTLNDFRLVRAHAIATWNGEQFEEVATLYAKTENDMEALINALVGPSRAVP